MRVGLRLLLASAVAVASAGPALAQNSGTIAGKVTERQTQRPLTGAQVRILGGTRGAVTDDSGSFRIVNVPPGTVQLSVVRIGYGPQSRTVTVTAGGTTAAEFTL